MLLMETLSTHAVPILEQAILPIEEPVEVSFYDVDKLKRKEMPEPQQ